MKKKRDKIRKVSYRLTLMRRMVVMVDVPFNNSYMAVSHVCFKYALTHLLL